MMEEQTDISLIEAAARGDSKACGVIVQRFGGTMFGIIVKMVGDRRDAEELTQDALLKGIRSIDSYVPGRASLKTWLCCIAYRTALSHLRHRGLATVSVDEGAISGMQPEDSQVQESDDDRVERLQHALRRLSDEERMLVTLFYYENMPLSDIACITDSTPNALGVRLHRIRQKLYSMIK